MDNLQEKCRRCVLSLFDSCRCSFLGYATPPSERSFLAWEHGRLQQDIPAANRRAIVSLSAIQEYRTTCEGGMELKRTSGIRQTVSRRRARHLCTRLYSSS